MSPGHCSDEQLIAHLDSELHWLGARMVRRHLASCWQCRARMRELEDQALRIAKAVSADTFPGTRGIPPVERFISWKSQLAGQAPSRGRKLHWIAAAACVAIAAIVGLSRRESAAPPPPDPRAILTAARQTEESLVRQPVHQSLGLEISSLETGARTTSRLELWSDATRDRFAFEWRQSDGRLKQALWRSDRQPAARFDPVRDEGRSSFIQVAASAADLLEMEASLYRWLKGRALQPVSLSANFAEFAGQDGVTVSMERLDTRTARLTAVRLARELILEIDLPSSRPRSLLLRIREAGRTTQLLLTADRFEALRSDQMQRAVFEPKLPAAAAAPAPSVEAETVAEPAGSLPSLPDFEAREIEVHFLLHRVRSCLGDEIAVGHDPSGRVTVRGLVESAARKSEIVTALHGLADVKVELETIAEAGARRPRVIVHGSVPTTLRVDNADFPMRARIEAIAGRQQEVARFANDAVSLSGSALAEAWAIHRLTLAFPDGSHDPLGLVKQMLQDHGAAFASRLGELRALLGPALPAVAASSTPVAATPLAPAQQIDDLVRSLFSVSSLSIETADTNLERLAGVLAATTKTSSTGREP